VIPTPDGWQTEYPTVQNEARQYIGEPLRQSWAVSLRISCITVVTMQTFCYLKSLSPYKHRTSSYHLESCRTLRAYLWHLLLGSDVNMHCKAVEARSSGIGLKIRRIVDRTATLHA
jgi:hypothetical protein